MDTEHEGAAAGGSGGGLRGKPGPAPSGGEDIAFKDMCARFAVTPRTLRYYEQMELLSPRREGRARVYGPREVARMTLIMRGRRFGFSLEEIRQWLLMRGDRGTAEQMRVFAAAADRRIEALSDAVRRIEGDIEALRRLRDVARRGAPDA